VSAYNNEHAKNDCDEEGGLSVEVQQNHRTSVFLKQYYHSLGVSIPVSMLPVVTRHANLEFYNQPIEYNEREFGTQLIYKGIQTLHSHEELEQDSLIGKREYTARNLLTLFPYCSRAYHAGFVGYNRKTTKAPDSIDDSQVQGGSVLERAASLMAMSEAEMNADTEIKDIKQVPLEHGYHWNAGELHCDFEGRSGDSTRKWEGSNCDFAVSCECHAFGGWALKTP
jgi:hypothetical protein